MTINEKPHEKIEEEVIDMSNFKPKFQSKKKRDGDNSTMKQV